MSPSTRPVMEVKLRLELRSITKDAAETIVSNFVAISLCHASSLIQIPRARDRRL